MNSEKILFYGSSNAGFALYPKMADSIQKTVTRLVNEGKLIRSEKLVGQPGEEWICVVYFTVGTAIKIKK